MKTLPLVKYCMKNIYALWAVNKKKYSTCSSKLLMNVSAMSAMCVTLLSHKKIQCIIYRIASLCNSGSFIHSFNTSEDMISSSKCCFLSSIAVCHTNQDATWNQMFKLILLILL